MGDRLGFDHAGRPADYGSFVATAAAAGYSFEMRYLCFTDDPSFDASRRSLNAMKVARPNEVLAALAAGLEVALIWQNAKQDATGGFDAGRRHGAEAERQALALGYPAGRVIYFAVGDYDAPDTDLPHIREYLRGVHEGCTRYAIGGYGKRSVVEDALGHGSVVKAWQSYGFSRPIGAVSPQAALYQRQGGTTIAGVACDVDAAYQDIGGWKLARNPICPFAQQYILHGEEDRRAIINPIASALHIAVTTASGDSLGRYFDREDITDDSTFYIDHGGGTWQFSPVNRKANAQFSGNAIAVSIETEGMSGPLTDLQVKALIRLYAWLFTEWGISLSVSTRWDGPGAGWHSKYPEWNRDAHQCPGQARVDQLLNIILPGARQLVAGEPPLPPHTEDVMVPSCPVPWVTGLEPYFKRDSYYRILPGPEENSVLVASFNGAPLDEVPVLGVDGGWHAGGTFREGMKDGKGRVVDRVAYGIWCRVLFDTMGGPDNVWPRDNDTRVVVCTVGGGTYTIARKP